MCFAGRDGTEEFKGVGHSEDAHQMLRKYKIGVLPEGERAEEADADESGWYGAHVGHNLCRILFFVPVLQRTRCVPFSVLDVDCCHLALLFFMVLPPGHHPDPHTSAHSLLPSLNAH